MAHLLIYLLSFVALFLDYVSGVRYYSGYRYYRSYRYYRYYYVGYTSRYYYNYTNVGSTYAGRVAGIVIGCLIFVGTIIAIIIICCKHARQRRSRGRLITPGVFAPSTSPAPGTMTLQGSTMLSENANSTVTYSQHPTGTSVAVVSPGNNPQPYIQNSTLTTNPDTMPTPPSYDTTVGNTGGGYPASPSGAISGSDKME